MTVALAGTAGFLTARLWWLLLRPAFAAPVLQRENYRGHLVATAAGVVLPLSLLLVEAGRALAGAAGIGDAGGPPPARVVVTLVVLGMALVGVFDDLAGSGDARGFRGHLASLARGRLTTGGVKVLAGAAVALVAVAPAAGASLGRLLADAALVALAANVGNLFDRGPGRAIKAGSGAFVVLAVVTAGSGALTGVAVVAGAALALLLDDLHERVMLGDAGANALGAAVGAGVVVACAPATRNLVLVVVVVLNLAGEMVSFGKVIDSVAPLRALDRAGRVHRGGTGGR
ncbi:MAG: hypothetical protein M3P85_11650 [Actinomycetota bacterium]|nr:hypothetical protein [Actinomycetota bacterium]PLS75497.1 MAG: hypothetical protein CYG61_06975 [Actinomycetota bacterium]